MLCKHRLRNTQPFPTLQVSIIGYVFYEMPWPAGHRTPEQHHPAEQNGTPGVTMLDAQMGNKSPNHPHHP